MNLSATPTGYRVDIEAATSRAYRAVLDNRRQAAELAWLPFIIVFGLEFFGFLIGGGGVVGSVVSGLARVFGFIVFGTIFYARWYRFLLLGETDSRQLFTRPWQTLMAVSFKFAVLMFLGAIVLRLVAGLPPHAITLPLAILGTVGLAVAAVRVSLVFPAAALEEPILFRTAWELLAGNYWRLFAAAFLCFVPFLVVEGVLDRAGSGKVWIIGMVIELAGLAIEFAGMAVLAALFSDAYQGIVAAVHEEAPDAAR